MGHEHEAILVFGPSGWPTAYTWMFDLVDGPGWYANDLEPGFHKGPRLEGPVRWMWLVRGIRERDVALVQEGLAKGAKGGES